MLKNLFIISDIEMGAKDMFDDFKDENVLIKFIDKVTTTPGKNILIFNGDTFDFLKMPYLGEFTHHITLEISLWKAEKIIASYQKVFQALKKFLSKKANKIYFITGNHDFDLMWPEVQKRFQEALENHDRVIFQDYYENQEVYIEHGHQLDYFYKIDPNKKFIKYKGQELINIPFGYLAVIKYFIELKKQFPIEEKHYPRHKTFEYFPEFKRLKERIAVKFLTKALFFNFILGIGDPIANVPYINLIKHIFQHGLEIYDETKFSRKRFKQMIKQHPRKKVYVMGHVHSAQYNALPHNNLTLITDTWREEYKIISATEKYLAPKTYIQIVYDNNLLQKVDLLTFA